MNTPLQTYRLPDGSIIQADATATKSAEVIDYTLVGGERVLATRVDPEPVPGDIVWVEDGRFRGCILTLLARKGGWWICRNDSFGEYYGLVNGENVYAIRTRKVALYLTRDEIQARLDGANIKGRPSAAAVRARQGAA